MPHLKVQPYDAATFASCTIIEIVYVNADYTIDYKSRCIRKAAVLRIQTARAVERIDLYLQDGHEIEIEWNALNEIYGYTAAVDNNEFYENILEAIFGTRATLP